MNRIQFIILSYLLKEGATHEVNAFSVAEMLESMDGLNYSYNSVYKNTALLCKAELVKKGLPVGNSNTYYITGAGMAAVEKIKSKGDEA